MQVAFLVANPAASQFTGGLHRSVARSLSRRFEVEPIWPNSPDEARGAAARAVTDGAGLVIAMGGDGVVHHVAQGLIGSKTPLAIIPAGTTNVVARLAGIPERPSAAVKLLTGEHAIVPQPVLEVDAETQRGPLHRAALFALGVGPDALVVAAADAEPYRKYRFGGVHYARTALAVTWGQLRKMRPNATLSAGGQTRRVIGAMAQFRPAYTFFGRVPLRFETATPAPMTVLAIERVRMRKTLSIVRGALGKGGLDRVAGFEVLPSVESMSIRSDRPLLAQADGELLAEVTSLEARFRADGFLLAIPPQ